MFMPCLDALRRQFPQADITLVLHPRSKTVVPLLKQVNRIIVEDTDPLSLFQRIKKTTAFLKDYRPDVIICEQIQFNNLLPLFIGLNFVAVPIVISYQYFNLTSPRVKILREIPYDMNHRETEPYRAITYLVFAEELLRLLGLPVPNPAFLSVPTYSVPPSDKAEADLFFERIEQGKTEKRIFIHCLGSKENLIENTPKTLPVSFWQRLIKDLFEKVPDAACYFIGAPNESQDVDDMIAAIQPVVPTMRLTNLAPYKLPFDKLAALFSVGNLFVGTDSSPMHLAVAVNLELIGIFGPSNPARYLPKESFCHSVFNPEPSCRPCLWGTRDSVCDNMVCLNIPATDVVNVAEAILNKV